MMYLKFKFQQDSNFINICSCFSSLDYNFSIIIGCFFSSISILTTFKIPTLKIKD